MATHSNGLAEACGADERTVQIPDFNLDASTANVSVNQNSHDYKAGFQNGLDESAARDGSLRNVFCDAEKNFETQLNAMDACYKKQFLKLLQRLFAAIAPNLARRSTLQEVTALVETQLARNQTRIVVRMHPELVDLLLEAPNLAADDQSIVSIEKDQSMAANAFEAKWADGGISNDVDALIAAINQTISGHAISGHTISGHTMAGRATKERQGCDDD